MGREGFRRCGKKRIWGGWEREGAGERGLSNGRKKRILEGEGRIPLLQEEWNGGGVSGGGRWGGGPGESTPQLKAQRIGIVNGGWFGTGRDFTVTGRKEGWW